VPTIVSIVFKPAEVEAKPADRYARIAVDSAEMVAGKGIDGDRKGSGEERHLNVMSRETLDTLRADGCKTGPGEMGEQIVVDGIDVNRLLAGTRLRLGSAAMIEVVKPRTGCARFERIQKIAIKHTTNRLGVMCRVDLGGQIHVGDEVAVILAGDRK
jgi:MOSC domain-containing protein YiiM